jgi:mannose-6-phosphate isomerase-like protein (cupin superfamily)
MRIVALLGILGLAAPASGQTPSASAKSTISIEVTNPLGLGLSGIEVEMAGPVSRAGTTDASGFVRFLTLVAGTYRARFSGDEVIMLEKDIMVAARKHVETEATLNPAAPKPEPPPPPPPSPVIGQAGSPQITSLIDILERQRIPKGQTRLETLVACSGNTRSSLLQLTHDQPERIYEAAEVLLYVLAGEAVVSAGGHAGTVQPGGFVSIPRGTPFTVSRRGKKPVMALTVLAGEPCAQAQ